MPRPGMKPLRILYSYRLKTPNSRLGLFRNSSSDILRPLSSALRFSWRALLGSSVLSVDFEEGSLVCISKIIRLASRKLN